MRGAPDPCQFFFTDFRIFFPVRIGCAGLTRNAARRKILAPEHSDARNKISSAILFCDRALRRGVLQRLRVQGFRRALRRRCQCARLRRRKVHEPPLDLQIEQKLDPLTKEDVELYLQVMRAAAERVKNLTPADRAALDGAKRILAGGASGRVPTPDDVKTLAQANLVATSMDQIVAGEMKLDGRTYRGIAEAVEAAVPNPAVEAASRVGGAPPASHASTPLEKRLNDVNSANEKFLAPYREEIQQLIVVVRNPANLPK